MAGNKLAILAAVTLLLSQFVVKSQDFDYGEQGDDWTGLCATGQSQSPIDIVTDDVAEVDSDDDTVSVVTTFYDFTGAFIVNRGSPAFSDRTSANGLGSMKINDDLFKIVNIHFHTPAEHLVDGKRYDLELHLFGSTEDGKLLESAIFFEEGDENDFIQDIIDSIETAESKSFSLSSVYDEGELDKYYYYIGSISAPLPECAENTPWVIMEDPLELSSEQLAYFEQTWREFATYDNEGRYRNVQPLNGRKVYHYDDSSLYLALSSLLLAFFLI